MLKTLNSQALTINLCEHDLGFADTTQFIGQDIGWIGQGRAETATRFGLNMQQQGFHLLVLGSPGSGRTSLMLEAIHAAAAKRETAPDLVYLYNFEAPDQPLALRLNAGSGVDLRNALDQFVRQLARVIPAFLNDVAVAQSAQEAQADLPAPEVQTDTKTEASDEALIDLAANERVLMAVNRYLDEQIAKLDESVKANISQSKILTQYLDGLKRDTLENLEIFQINPNAEPEVLIESFLSRYRVNLLINHRHAKSAPVIYDDDPTFQSLFGGLDSAADAGGSTPEFMRLRAGNLLRADGGYLMLHLRDILADQQNGSQILEKLHRFLRNGRVQIEELAGASGHGSVIHLTPEALAVKVKVILIATREEYYQLQDESPELASYFRVKVDFDDFFRQRRKTARRLQLLSQNAASISNCRI